MSLQIKMRGDLTPTAIPGDFKDVVDAIQLVTAQGKEFLIMDKNDGNKIAFLMANLNSIEEVDDDAY